MMQTDLILLHPPSIHNFRERPLFFGPISDVIPSSSIFENYPIGFLTLSEYLNRHNISVRIVNLALKILADPGFDPDAFIARQTPAAFGIDLHWLPHVDGCLSLAAAIKVRHPHIPVILGGFSATYYHQEIMRDYPCVDFIVRGDSTEIPLCRLMECIKRRGDFYTVPNLVWRNASGETVINAPSFLPESIDYVRFDYTHPIKMTWKYHDPSGYLPFRTWLKNPVMAVFTCRGCYHDCGSCGGSRSASAMLSGRRRPAFRSPELLAKDIRNIARYTGAPIMVIGDLLQGGEDYADVFLKLMKRYRIGNELAVEFFHPPDASMIGKMEEALPNFNVELSPESHDPRIRAAFGKSYDNRQLEASIEALVAGTCRRLDLFFMVGLPFQTYQSVMETVDYCRELLEKYGKSGKLLPMIAPLAPFVDPGSRFFEEPDRFGYRIFYRTLAEHRSAMLLPTWKQRLNYETDWMSRDEIVRATYDGALRLVELKAAHGLISRRDAREICDHIRSAQDLLQRIEAAPAIDDSLKAEIFRLNRLDALCDKRELLWPIKGWRFNLLNVVKLFFE